MTTNHEPRITRDGGSGYRVDVDGLTPFRVWRIGRYWQSDVSDMRHTTRRSAIEHAVAVATSWPSTVGDVVRPTVRPASMVVGRAYRFTDDGHDGVVVVSAIDREDGAYYVRGSWMYDDNVGHYRRGTTYPTADGLGVFDPSDRVVDVTDTDDATLTAGRGARAAWVDRYGREDDRAADRAEIAALDADAVRPADTCQRCGRVADTLTCAADGSAVCVSCDADDHDAEDDARRRAAWFRDDDRTVNVRDRVDVDDAACTYVLPIRVTDDGDVCVVDDDGDAWVIGRTVVRDRTTGHGVLSDPSTIRLLLASMTDADDPTIDRRDDGVVCDRCRDVVASSYVVRRHGQDVCTACAATMRAAATDADDTPSEAVSWRGHVRVSDDGRVTFRGDGDYLWRDIGDVVGSPSTTRDVLAGQTMPTDDVVSVTLRVYDRGDIVADSEAVSAFTVGRVNGETTPRAVRRLLAEDVAETTANGR